jgi:hypothetical protein
VAVVQVGVQQAPSYEDWTWAVATFWSRAQSLPVPSAGPPAATTTHGGPAAGAAGMGGHQGALRVLEGIVPGLDFANHSMTVSTVSVHSCSAVIAAW